MNSSLPPTIEPNKTYRGWSISSNFQSTSGYIQVLLTRKPVVLHSGFYTIHTVLPQKWTSLQMVKKSPVCEIVGGREQFKIDSEAVMDNGIVNKRP